MNINDLDLLINRCTDEIFVIRWKDVSVINLADSFWNGRTLGHTEAGDASIFNRNCPLYDELINSGKEVFGEDFENIEFHDADDHVVIENFDMLELKATEKDVMEFMNKYEKDNCCYEWSENITYWDGSNHNSILIGYESGAYDYYTEDDKEDILQNFIQALEKSGCNAPERLSGKEISSGNFSYDISSVFSFSLARVKTSNP